ncbi:hypothetical protein AcV5_008889 [Taiwanofungus camphoratus]|nr:hypothetical protein AcV5_008889 [Antrodia cinnamomea]
MDTDDQQSPKYNLQPTNALAGPSSIPDLREFLPPPGPPQQPPHFTSTQDLLSRFCLTPAYDKYVRPYVTPVGQQPSTPGATAPPDKGKGKEKELPAQGSSVATPGAVDADDEEGKGEKKWKNSYKHLIKGIPGRHSMKKDDYLTTTIQVPPKQKIAITPFDLKTQREAFSVSLEGLKGWNINALVAESPQAREDRKKRKELKKLAKAQALVPFAGTGTSTPTALPTTPAPAAVATPGASAPPRTATPKPGTRVPPIVHPNPGAAPGQQRGRTPVGIGTPQSMSTPGPAPVLPAHTPVPVPASVRPTATPAPTMMLTPTLPNASPGPGTAGEVRRGVKREREHSVDGLSVQTSVQVNGVTGVAQTQGQGHPGYAQSGNGNGGAAKPLVVTGAKAGNAGVRPRPLKKQRTDLKGQAREMPVQQPTPHA